MCTNVKLFRWENLSQLPNEPVDKSINFLADRIQHGANTTINAHVAILQSARPRLDMPWRVDFRNDADAQHVCCGYDSLEIGPVVSQVWGECP